MTGVIAEVRVQSALSRELGVRCTPLADGIGHRVDGIAPETLDVFATRPHTVTQAQLPLAR